MSQELLPYAGKRPVIMKSGLVHWLSENKANELEKMIETQSAHGFIKIGELGVTINTADIEGVYTMKQYEDMGRVKQGMWQCEYGNWHNKGKKECYCKQEAAREAARKRQEEEDKERNKPLSEEEKAEGREKFLTSNEEAALAGHSIIMNMFRKGNRDGRQIRRKTYDAYVAKHGEIEQGLKNALNIEGVEEAKVKTAKQEAHEVFA